MAKAKEAPSTAVAKPAAPRGNAVVEAGRVNSAFLRNDAQANVAQFNREDMAIPFIRVAQANSPQLKKSEVDKYIEDLTEGDFFHTVTRQIWEGDEGILVAPVFYLRSHIEFQKRENGGGIVKDWGTDNSRVKLTTRDDLGRSILPSGNQLVVSGLYFIVVVDEESGAIQNAAFALASTQLKKAKAWNSYIKGLRLTDDQGQFEPAPYYMTYKVTTGAEKNEKGSWMGVKIEPYKPLTEFPNGEAAYLLCQEYAKLVKAGEVKLDEPVASVGTREEDDDVPF